MSNCLSRRQFLGSALIGGVALTAGVSGKATSAAAAPANAAHSKVKNVIYMIGDGWGYAHMNSASFYQYGKRDGQVYHDFPVKISMSTYPHGGSYDPKAAWKTFDYVNKGATDSAAAGTAMATGHKTKSGQVNMDPDGEPLRTIMHHAADLGKATGILSSVQLSHATPASFWARNIARGNYEEIGQELIESSKLDLLMGAGHPWYDDNNQRIDEPNYDFVGGRGVWERLMLGQAGTETGAPWTLVETRDEFRALKQGDTPERLIGIPMVANTLQHNRDGDASDLPYEVTFNKNVPTLQDMTEVALNHLGHRKSGFALMIEGGAIDWAGHGNASGRMLEEAIDFDNAVQSVVDWIEANSSWEETLLIVTADHETGYLTGPGSGEESIPKWRPVRSQVPGEVPEQEWHSGGHTNQVVPYFAKGVGAEEIVANKVGDDPVRGAYVDNTTTAKLLFEWL